MGRVVKVQASEDIWHLGIEDLLAPPRGSARTAGPGPFVIILRTSTARIGSPPKGLLPIDRLHVYQLMRGHDARPQFQLRLGIIESEQEADALLSMVREHYPGAIKERAEDDDKAAIARAACPAEPAKTARAVAAAKPPVVPVPKKATPPAARQAAQKPTQHCRWDIDELLPQLAAARPLGREPSPPTSTASKSERKPPKLATPRRSEKAQMPSHSGAARRAKPSAQSRPNPPLEETRHPPDLPPLVRRWVGPSPVSDQ